MDFGGIFVQVSRMSLWNYGTEVMDALVELITSLVHDFFFFLCHHWIFVIIEPIVKFC